MIKKRFTLRKIYCRKNYYHIWRFFSPKEGGGFLYELTMWVPLFVANFKVCIDQLFNLSVAFFWCVMVIVVAVVVVEVVVAVVERILSY